ncbi:hypothetical protein Tco_0806750 [Tanacetum coccineum]
MLVGGDSGGEEVVDHYSGAFSFGTEFLLRRCSILHSDIASLKIWFFTKEDGMKAQVGLCVSFVQRIKYTIKMVSFVQRGDSGGEEVRLVVEAVLVVVTMVTGGGDYDSGLKI